MKLQIMELQTNKIHNRDVSLEMVAQITIKKTIIINLLTVIMTYTEIMVIVTTYTKLMVITTIITTT